MNKGSGRADDLEHRLLELKCARKFQECRHTLQSSRWQRPEEDSNYAGNLREVLGRRRRRIVEVQALGHKRHRSSRSSSNSSSSGSSSIAATHLLSQEHEAFLSLHVHWKSSDQGTPHPRVSPFWSSVLMELVVLLRGSGD